jgi:hypothetical protein
MAGMRSTYSDADRLGISATTLFAALHLSPQSELRREQSRDPSQERSEMRGYPLVAYGVMAFVSGLMGRSWYRGDLAMGQPDFHQLHDRQVALVMSLFVSLGGRPQPNDGLIDLDVLATLPVHDVPSRKL